MTEHERFASENLTVITSDSRFSRSKEIIYEQRKAPAKRGHIVAATLCPTMFPVRGKTWQHCCAPRGHKKCFWKFSETFFVSRTQVSTTNVARVAKRVNIWETRPRQQCCCRNVSSFCPPLNATIQAQIAASPVTVHEFLAMGKSNRPLIFCFQSAEFRHHNVVQLRRERGRYLLHRLDKILSVLLNLLRQDFYKNRQNKTNQTTSTPLMLILVKSYGALVHSLGDCDTFNQQLRISPPPPPPPPPFGM